MTGGTPEAVVAGIAVGFKTIIYVASDDNEELIQKNDYPHPHLLNVIEHHDLFGLFLEPCFSWSCADEAIVPG